MSKTRNEKLREYEMKYSHIPKDNDERLWWLINQYKLSPSKMQDIIEKKYNITSLLQYYDYKIILYEEPEGAKRPRFQMINRKNYMNFALSARNFVHVYSPDAAEDHKYFHRLLDNELLALQKFIQTPCQICINTFSKTPSYFNAADTILAEIGVHRNIQKPDFDNIAKKYCDMFNENIWLDDQLVLDGEVHKYFSVLPRVEICIRYLNYISTPYQYNQIISKSGYDPSNPVQYLNEKGLPANDV